MRLIQVWHSMNWCKDASYCATIYVLNYTESAIHIPKCSFFFLYFWTTEFLTCHYYLFHHVHVLKMLQSSDTGETFNNYTMITTIETITCQNTCFNLNR